MVNVSQRAAEAADRAVLGHWEGDLLLGKRSVTAIATLVGRALTWGQGPKMRDCRQVRVDAGIEIYFCDPHAPWQRGSNEIPTGCCAGTSRSAPGSASSQRPCSTRSRMSSTIDPANGLGSIGHRSESPTCWSCTAHGRGEGRVEFRLCPRLRGLVAVCARVSAAGHGWPAE